jgi:hypothetical protein
MLGLDGGDLRAEVLVTGLVGLLGDDRAAQAHERRAEVLGEAGGKSLFKSFRIATFLTPSVVYANCATLLPWKSSRKHIRKMQSPTWVTFGFVEDGEIMGTPAAWQIGPPASERDDATSPITAMTWSWLMSFWTAVAASCAWDWSSSTTTRTGSPPILPCASLVSSAIATSTPSLVEPPNVASPPVSEPYSPITSSSFPPPPQPAARIETPNVTASSSHARSFMTVPLVKVRGPAGEGRSTRGATSNTWRMRMGANPSPES